MIDRFDENFYGNGSPQRDIWIERYGQTERDTDTGTDTNSQTET